MTHLYVIPLRYESVEYLLKHLLKKRIEKVLVGVGQVLAKSFSERNRGLIGISVQFRPQIRFGLFCDTALRTDILQLHARSFVRSLSRMKYVHYSQAQSDAILLAKKLRENYSVGDLKQFAFVGIPRGGLIVLGILSYVLGLEKHQLMEPRSPHSPLVIVDDCAYSGNQFARMLEQFKTRKIIFAHLYSSPQLRQALLDKEKRVVDCIAAHDLHDLAPEHFGKRYSRWRKTWSTRPLGKRYWIGDTEMVCFPWTQPDRLVWNTKTRSAERSWKFLPADKCLKHRRELGTDSIPIYVQPAGRFPLRPSDDVLFGDFQDRVIIGRMSTRKCFRLDDVASSMWRTIVELGNIKAVKNRLLKMYHVKEAVLENDLEIFVQDLLEKGILMRQPARRSPSRP